MGQVHESCLTEWIRLRFTDAQQDENYENALATCPNCKSPYELQIGGEETPWNASCPHQSLFCVVRDMITHMGSMARGHEQSTLVVKYVQHMLFVIPPLIFSVTAMVAMGRHFQSDDDE